MLRVIFPLSLKEEMGFLRSLLQAARQRTVDAFLRGKWAVDLRFLSQALSPPEFVSPHMRELSLLSARVAHRRHQMSTNRWDLSKLLGRWFRGSVP